MVENSSFRCLLGYQETKVPDRKYENNSLFTIFATTDGDVLVLLAGATKNKGMNNRPHGNSR